MIMATRLPKLFALVAVGLLAAQQQAGAQEEEESIQSCLGLSTAVREATTLGTAVSFDLANDITCDDYITISRGQDITIRSSGAGAITHTITIATDFLANSSSSSSSSTSQQSLLEVQEGGILALDGIKFVREDSAQVPAEGVRAIYNKGTLTVNNCAFDGLNTLAVGLLSEGGAIYTDSDENEVIIYGSNFTSNFASQRGGAICAVGTDLLTVEWCAFENNEVASQTLDGSGGDIFAISGAVLTVADSNFTESIAEYGGAAIECCGAVITNCVFNSAEAASADGHFGALLVGRPGQAECPHELVLTSSSFTACSVLSTTGAGGSLAIFDTSATIVECSFEASQATAVLFESSSPSGDHTISMVSSYFYDNILPAEEYAGDGPAKGAAMVVQNTGLSEGDEGVFMGEFYDIYCFNNSPYECEFVLDMADFDKDRDFKCQACNLEGDLFSASDISEESVERASPDSESTDSRRDLIIGLSSALAGSVLLLIGGVVAWKCFRKKNTTPSAGAQGKSEPAATAQEVESAGQPPSVAQPAVAVRSSPTAERSSSTQSPPRIEPLSPTVEAPPAAQTTPPAAHTFTAAPSLPIAPTAAQSPLVVERSSSAQSRPTAESASAVDAPPLVVAQTPPTAEAPSPARSPTTPVEAMPTVEAAPPAQADPAAQSPSAALSSTAAQSLPTAAKASFSAQSPPASEPPSAGDEPPAAQAPPMDETKSSAQSPPTSESPPTVEAPRAVEAPPVLERHPPAAQTSSLAEVLSPAQSPTTVVEPPATEEAAPATQT